MLNHEEHEEHEEKLHALHVLHGEFQVGSALARLGTRATSQIDTIKEQSTC
jgi:hypothetical protein